MAWNFQKLVAFGLLASVMTITAAGCQTGIEEGAGYEEGVEGEAYGEEGVVGEEELGEEGVLGEGEVED